MEARTVDAHEHVRVRHHDIRELKVAHVRKAAACHGRGDKALHLAWRSHRRSGPTMDVLANIDPTSSNSTTADPFRPSFFELIAQEQLSDLLKPAIRYVLTVLAQRHPRYLLRIVHRFDELYMVLMLAVERHYLRTWNASFTEHFYGLRRRRRPAVSTQRLDASVPPNKLQAARQLRDRDVNWSVFFLVGLPYLEAKVTDYWERMGGGAVVDGDDLWGDDDDDEPHPARRETLEERRRRQWITLVRRGYPYAQVAFQLWMLAYHIRYLFGRTPYWRPWLAAMRVDVRRAMGNEAPLRVGASSQRLPPFTRYPCLFAYLVVCKGTARVLDALKYALPAAIFVFKFLEWWYSPQNRRRRGDSDGDAVKRIGAPAILPPSPQGVVYAPLPTYRAPPVLFRHEGAEVAQDASAPVLLHYSCPLCGATPMHNASVLASGYACCYACATDYVDKWHRCPVTHMPLPGGVEQIRRVLV